MNCEVWAIHASKAKARAGQGRIPSALSGMAAELGDDQFAAYRSFHLLERKSFKRIGAKMGQQSFRAGYNMQLGLVQRKGSRLKVHVNLSARRRANLVDLDYWMSSGGLLMLVGGNYQDGKIVFATRCRAVSAR